MTTLLILLVACGGDRWETLTPMSIARTGHSATALQDGRVLVVGGTSSGGETLRSTQLYDPKSDTWTDGPNIAEARSDHTATVLGDGRVLVVGGRVGNVPVKSVFTFDPETDSFTEEQSLSRGRSSHTATFLGDGRLVVVGGFVDPLAPGPEVWDPDTLSWTEWDVPLQRTDHVAMVLRDGLLIAGGRDSDESTAPALQSTALLDLTDGTLTELPDMVAPRTGLGGASFNEGALVFAGATSNSGNPSSVMPSIERFDGTSWSGFGTLSAARTSPLVIGIGEQAVAVFGGVLGTDLRASAAVDVVDPSGPTILAGTDMPDGRMGAAAARLQDGRVLIVGGSDGIYPHTEVWAWTAPKPWR